MEKPVNPKKPAKLEDYELDNHVRTMQEAGKIMGDKHLMKAVHKHAKKKKSELNNITKMMKNDEAEAEDSVAEEKKEIKSISQIRDRSKKLKAKMSMVE